MAEHGANRTYDLPSGSPFGNHGKTVASWTLVWVACLGLLITGLGLVLWELWLVIVGVVVVVAGLLAGRIMRGMGMGQPRSTANHRSASDDDWYA